MKNQRQRSCGFGMEKDVWTIKPKPGPFIGCKRRKLLAGNRPRRKKKANRPAVVLSDLNDVAWSPRTSSFKSVGGLLDPRAGEGSSTRIPLVYRA